MDIIDLIKQDHAKVNKLMEKIEATTDEETEKRESLFSELRSCLEAHSNAEERFLYQRLEEADGLVDEIAESYEDHEIVGSILQSLSEMEINDEAWMKKFASLKEDVLAHVDEEENVVLLQAQELIPEAEREELGDDMASLEDEIISAGPGLMTQTPAGSMTSTNA